MWGVPECGAKGFRGWKEVSCMYAGESLLFGLCCHLRPSWTACSFPAKQTRFGDRCQVTSVLLRLCKAFAAYLHLLEGDYIPPSQ